MALNDLLASPSRHLFLSGSLTCLTGRVLSFSGDQAIAFSLSEGPSDGNLLGGAFSASCSLTLSDADGAFSGGVSLFGAQAEVRLCAGEESAPLCVFTVGKVTRREGDPRLVLTGTDALATAFEGPLTDDFSYPLTLGSLARSIAAQAGFSLANETFPNASFVIPARPEWGDISLRQALSFAACAAGCFAAVDRQGRLVFRPVRSAALPRIIGPEVTLSHQNGDRSFGPLAAVSVSLKGARRGTPPLVVAAEGTAPGVYNTLSVSGNPLFPVGGTHTEALARALLSALEGYALSSAQVTWRGDPALQLGDPVRIRDAQGVVTDTVVTGQTLSFSRGFSMRTDCEAPVSAPAAGRLFTPSGALNAALLEGNLNGAIIRDGSIAASSLMAGSVGALQLAAGAVTTEKLSAGSVTADKVASGAVTADKLAAGSVTAEKMTADAVDALYAQISQADIDWANIQTLDAAIASIADARIFQADIDWSQIKDLVSRRALITQGEAGELYVARLAVTEANLLSLSVGEIMVKGQDGGLYALTVDPEGRVEASRKQIANDDIGDLSIAGSEKLIDGSVTARSLNAQEIFGENALVRRLIAETLDVDALFAREAVIRQLNALDITGNESIRLYVQQQEEMQAFLRITPEGLEIGRVGDTARFRADNRTLDVTNVKAERLGIAQAMNLPEEWAWIATRTGLGLKYVG